MRGIKSLNGLLESTSKKLNVESEDGEGLDMEELKDSIKDAIPDFARELTLSVQRWGANWGVEFTAEELTKATFWVAGLLKGKASELHKAAKLVARKGDTLNRQLKRSIESTEYPIKEDDGLDAEELPDFEDPEFDDDFEADEEVGVTDSFVSEIMMLMAAHYRADSGAPGVNADSMLNWDESQIADSMEFVARELLSKKARFKAIAKMVKRNPERARKEALMTLKGGV